jgi:hypothetical protein
MAGGVPLVWVALSFGSEVALALPSRDRCGLKT